jgi:hypothetical protein
MADALSQWQLRTDCQRQVGIIIMIHRVRRRFQTSYCSRKMPADLLPWPIFVSYIHTYNGKRMLPKIPREKDDASITTVVRHNKSLAMGCWSHTTNMHADRCSPHLLQPTKPRTTFLLGWLGKEVGWPGAAAEAGSSIYLSRKTRDSSFFFPFSPPFPPGLSNFPCNLEAKVKSSSIDRLIRLD